MQHDTPGFRARYRAGIPRWYNPWAHGGFMLAWGMGALWWFGQQLQAVRPLEWLTVPLALVFFNWGEYMVHRHAGHVKRRLGALFYKRHTGDHHSFFVEGQMIYETRQDWRVILFPPWLVVVFSAGAFGLWWALKGWQPNVAALFAQTLLAGYMGYELMHVCEHLPREHWIARLPGIRLMHRLHALHHRRDVMQSRNFNITYPLWDVLLGTLHREPDGLTPSSTPTARPGP